MTNHFEAKKHAYRQTQDGVVVSFVIHPSEVPNDLAIASLGTRYMVAFSEIGDNEKPIDPIDKRFPDGITPQQTPFMSKIQAEHKGPRPFSTLPLSQQAGIRSTDKDFARFIFDLPKGSMCINIERDEDIIPEWIRTLCGVQSRGQIIAGTKAGDAWLDLEAKFQTWRVDRRYAGSKR